MTNKPTGKLLIAMMTLSLASAVSAQQQPAVPAAEGAAKPRVAFPPTPTPQPKAPPMTEAQLDEFLIPQQYLARTSDVLCIIYNGFRRSQVDPCGCVTHQLGGLDKEARLVQRIEELKIPALEVDAGGFVRDLPDEKLVEQGRTLLKGLGKIGYDAVNVAFTDLAIAPDELKKAAQDAGTKLVSANVTDEAGKPVFDPFVVKDVKLTDGSTLKVGILGVTRPRVEMSAEPLDTPTSVTAGSANGQQVPLQISDPIAAINKYLPEVSEKADFVVLLDYDRRSNADKIIQKIADPDKVDVLVMGENTQIQGSVQNMKNIQVVSGGYEGRQLGTLYLELKDHKVASTWNRHIEVLQTIPPVSEITTLIESVHKKTEQPESDGSNSDGPMKLKL